MEKDTTKKMVILTYLGFFISVLGTIGTMFQIFGEVLVHFALIVSGIFIATHYIRLLTRDFMSSTQTLGRRWHVDGGRLRIGNTINVALRVDTIQIILSKFQANIQDIDKFSELLKDAGKDVGQDFSRDLIRELTQQGDRDITLSGKTVINYEKKIRKWISYDSSTGLGVFNVDYCKTVEGKLDAQISIVDSFLSYNSHSDLPTCSFLAGYIEGIFSGLFGLVFTVQEFECNSSTGSGCCRFKVLEC